ncbi:Pentatricopeptide repeat-containing protein [Forsythia ovata]|uniref:Pentatricopeptide repeat-containing protein n=1 Tax=Forsythia ovata TaxID=205694 RepID=A0ABD1TQK4_9LAMI
MTEEQKQAIAQIPPKMENRCRALLKQIICFSPENGSISFMLAAWVKSMNPQRANWLSGFNDSQVVEHAFTEESFEANVRDYTKMIHGYAKQTKLQEAENTLLAMKNRGFICDQVTLTALIHMYSKAWQS